MGSTLENLQAMAAGHAPSLPLKLLVVADCTARDGEPLRVTPEGTQGLLESLRPALKLQVQNRIVKGGAKIGLDLELNNLRDFRPASLVSRSRALSEAASSASPALGEQLDELLHHADFQRMEACWLGLDKLAQTLAGMENVQLEVMPATRKNLREGFHKSVFEPEYEGTTDIPLAAVYFDFRFSHEPGDLSLLESLAQDCSALQAPMIAAVSPAFFQLKNLAHLPNLP